MARTKGWLERTIVNSLREDDGRFKHGAASNVVSTAKVVEYHQGITDSDEATAKASVHRTLSSLQEKGLIKKYHEANHGGNGGSAAWMITEDGIAESRELQSMYLEKIHELREKLGMEHDMCATSRIKINPKESAVADE